MEMKTSGILSCNEKNINEKFCIHIYVWAVIGLWAVLFSFGTSSIASYYTKPFEILLLAFKISSVFLNQIMLLSDVS